MIVWLQKDLDRYTYLYMYKYNKKKVAKAWKIFLFLIFKNIADLNSKYQFSTLILLCKLL